MKQETPHRSMRPVLHVFFKSHWTAKTLIFP
jgi:hypothetical protein